MPQLFEPLRLRDVTLKNRIGVSPMCQYSAVDGLVNAWHHVHLGARAVGGAGLVVVEATAVEPEGRITLADVGLWNDRQAEALAPIAAFVRRHGAAPGIQLAHAGRKASVNRPWEGDRALTPEEGAWETLAPSAIPFGGNKPHVPREATEEDLQRVVRRFAETAARALAAGFELVELHAAHGYLLHSFLSPLSNRRTDRWGGDLAGRARLVREVTRAVRRVWPDRLPLAVRLSCTDWTEGGWTLDESVELARWLREDGVDLVDCSSGGNVPARIPVAPGYQVPFAERIRREASVPTAAVGLLTEPEQVEAVLAEGRADLVLLARAMLREAHWPVRAARVLGAPSPLPIQYARAAA